MPDLYACSKNQSTVERRQTEVFVCKTTNFCLRLRERHQDVLRQKLFKLKQEQGVESEPLFPIIKEEPRSDEEV